MRRSEREPIYIVTKVDRTETHLDPKHFAVSALHKLLADQIWHPSPRTITITRNSIPESMQESLPLFCEPSVPDDSSETAREMKLTIDERLMRRLKELEPSTADRLMKGVAERIKDWDEIVITQRHQRIT